MRSIGVVGAGHVGLVTGSCFASLGNKVICADNDKKKIENLQKGKLPFYEPGLAELVNREFKKGNLQFTVSIDKLARSCEIIFIAVGTPSLEGGRADLSFVEQVSVEIANSLSRMVAETKEKSSVYRLIVEKSTVPVLTAEWVKRTFKLLGPTGVTSDIAANPEFLREGNAIKDFMEPDRIVVGAESKRAINLFKEIYRPIKAPLIFTDIKSAELIKHASNSFLALKISYINAVSQICEKVGADAEKVAEGMGIDKRIGKHFLKAGVGYGGSCFPKDVSAFAAIAEEVGYSFDLLKEVQEINKKQKLVVIKKARDLLWNLKKKQIAVLGLSFKPETDDIRESPAIEVIQNLKNEGAHIKCYDPQATENMKKIFPEIDYCRDIYQAVENVHLMIFLTDWQEFKKADFKKIKNSVKMPYIIDGRNFLDYKKLQKMGFVYRGIGRKNWEK
jgi:UDPglucose 6-dehydrogenase